jgi:hypothetical protein
MANGLYSKDNLTMSIKIFSFFNFFFVDYFRQYNFSRDLAVILCHNYDFFEDKEI